MYLRFAKRILLETDCPYLAPVPHRGRRNEPAFLPHVAEALASLKGWTLEDTVRRTTDAFFTLFRKMDFKTDDPAPLCSEVGEDDGAD